MVILDRDGIVTSMSEERSGARRPRATMRQVAALAGVGTKTVSRVIERCKLTFHESVYGTWISGLKFQDADEHVVQIAVEPVPLITLGKSGNWGSGLKAGAPRRSFSL